MIDIGLDKYGIHARLQPALLSLLPVFITVAVSAPELYEIAVSLAALAATCGLTVALAHFAEGAEERFKSGS